MPVTVTNSGASYRSSPQIKLVHDKIDMTLVDSG